MLPPLKPIPMKERVSMIFIQYGQIDVKDGAFVVIDKNGERKHIIASPSGRYGPNVIWRKLSFASRSLRGAQFRPMILPICQSSHIPLK